MGDSNNIKVVYLTRRQRPLGNFSVEIYFNLVRENLQKPFVGIFYKVPYQSNGFSKRLANAISCIFQRGNIKHITGDIHYIATFLKKKNTVLTILDCGILHDTAGLKHKIVKLFWYTIPVKRSAVITAISQATKDDIIRFTNCDPGKIKVVPVCLHPMFTRMDKEFDAKKPRILQIGTAHNKNISRLAPALEGISCKLVVVGKMENDVLKLLEQHNIDFEMIDRRLSDEEILEEYKKCDIVSFVSTLEGFGIPIVEGNAVGRAVITGNVTSMPEVAAGAAHLVDPFSISCIREGFIKIIDDAEYRSELIQQGFENCKRFSGGEIARQFMDIYQAIVHKGETRI